MKQRYVHMSILIQVMAQLDLVFLDFAGDARSLRLGMSTDETNPFGIQSANHST